VFTTSELPQSNRWKRRTDGHPRTWPHWSLITLGQSAAGTAYDDESGVVRSWLGAISICGLALLPFGFEMPKANVAATAFGAGVLELIADYFYYAALKVGEASEYRCCPRVSGVTFEISNRVRGMVLSFHVFVSGRQFRPLNGDRNGNLLLNAGHDSLFASGTVPSPSFAGCRAYRCGH